VAKEPVSSSRIALTPEDKLIADSFKAKGSLPWPVEKGFISLGYGDQAHPIYNTLVIHNSGVESLLMKVLRHELFWWRSSQYYGAVTGKQGGNDTTRDYFPYIKT
jgi:hypothetical protein